MVRSREHRKLHHSIDAINYTTMFNFAGTDAHAHVWVGPGLAKLLSTSWITHAKELCAFIVLKMPKKYGQYVTLHWKRISVFIKRMFL